MNERKAREIIREYDEEMRISRRYENDFEYQKMAILATGYLEAIEKAKMLEDCLLDVLYVLDNFDGSFKLTEGKEFIYSSPDVEFDLSHSIREVLSKWEEKK